MLERKIECVKVEGNSLQRQFLRSEEVKLVKALEQEKKTAHTLDHHLRRFKVTNTT